MPERAETKTTLIIQHYEYRHEPPPGLTLEVNQATQDEGMMADNLLQTAIKTPQKNNALYSAGTLGIFGSYMTVTSHMTTSTSDITMQYVMKCRRICAKKRKRLERNPTVDSL